jgi:YLATT-like protein
MFPPITIVVLIILVAGLVGGLAAHVVAERAQTPGDGLRDRAAMREFLLLGIIAAACVPLFLSLLKSQMLTDIFRTTATDGTPNLPAFEPYLIFLGLCLIAAFSARRFIDTVSSQVFQRLDKVDAKASRAVETAESAKEVANEAVVEAEDADNLKAPLAADLKKAKAHALTGKEAAAPLSPEERRILEAMTLKVYRTRSGIVEDSGVSRNQISEMLEDLAERKLALPTSSPRTGGQRWIITDRGRAALAVPS